MWGAGRREGGVGSLISNGSLVVVSNNLYSARNYAACPSA